MNTLRVPINFTQNFIIKNVQDFTTSQGVCMEPNPTHRSG